MVKGAQGGGKTPERLLRVGGNLKQVEDVTLRISGVLGDGKTLLRSSFLSLLPYLAIQRV